MSEVNRPSRRTLLKLGAGAVACSALARTARGEGAAMARGSTVRDRLWLFGVPANVNYPYLHHRSLMTPAEGALYLSIPNVIMVQVKDKAEGVEYKGFEPPYAQYAIALRPFKRVAWFAADGNGFTTSDDRDEILGLAKTESNFAGVFMDDFFHRPPGVPPAALTLDQLRDLRQRLRDTGKKLDIFVTLYTDFLNLPIRDYLALIDVVTLWSHTAADLENIDANLKKAHQLAPTSRILLGCYFYEFGARKPISVASMKLQCEAGLRSLREGNIDGIVFLGNSVEDSGFECIEWTRDWIQKVGDMTL